MKMLDSVASLIPLGSVSTGKPSKDLEIQKRICQTAWDGSEYNRLHINTRIKFPNGTCLLTKNFERMIDPYTPSVLRPIPKMYLDAVPADVVVDASSLLDYEDKLKVRSQQYEAVPQLTPEQERTRGYNESRKIRDANDSHGLVEHLVHYNITSDDGATTYSKALKLTDLFVRSGADSPCHPPFNHPGITRQLLSNVIFSNKFFPKRLGFRIKSKNNFKNGFFFRLRMKTPQEVEGTKSESEEEEDSDQVTQATLLTQID